MFMKISHIFIWIFLLLIFVCVRPNYAQSNEPEETVRLVYFVPKGSKPQTDIKSKLNARIKDAQQFFASEMDRHGFGRKTFQIETDATGNVIVHRVNGRFADNYYQHQTTEKTLPEVFEIFKQPNNIYFIAIEIGTTFLDSSGQDHAEACGRGGLSDGQRGFTIIPASGECVTGVFGSEITAHELGHAFGLYHDFRSDAYLMSYGFNRNQLSGAAADWLDVHPYFNTSGNWTNQQDASIQLQSIEIARPDALRFQFTVTDVDSAHQIQFLTPAPASATHNAPGEFHLIGYQRLKGERDRINFESVVRLGNFEMTNQTEFGIQVIDVKGNFTRQGFQIDVLQYLPAVTIVSIPDKNLAAAVRENLGLAADATITQFHMLQLIVFWGSKEPVKDLSGLEHAKNLKRFTQFGGQISDLTPLAGLTDLQYLGLVACQIRDLTLLKGLKNLRWLDLYENNITDLSPLSELTQLEILQIYENQIRDLTPLAALTQLRSLALEHNQIRDLTPLAGLKQLRTLLLGNNLNSASSNRNQIRDISALVDLTNLETLRLYGNPIDNYLPLLRLVERNPNLKTDVELTHLHLPILLKEDVNADGVVNIQDLVRVASHLGQSADGISADVNADGVINIQDLVLVAGAFKKGNL